MDSKPEGWVNDHVDHEFAELKRLILYRLDQSDQNIKDLSHKVDERCDALGDKITELRTDMSEGLNKHAIEIALLKVKSMGLGAISGIVTGIITALVTAMEYVKRMGKP